MVVKLFEVGGSPAGMFTRKHLGALIICISIILFILIRTRNIKWQKLEKMTKIYAFLITFLELVKIVYSFSIGHTWLDAWFPLSFCSLFIYSLWLASFSKRKLQKLGISFISIGAFTGGLAFLIFPTTSLMQFPITHFLCLYSLFFHSSMICFSILYLRTCPIKLDKELKKYYFSFFSVAAFISIMINFTTNSNLMILREPYNIPIPILHKISSVCPAFYTIIAIFTYIFATLSISSILDIIIKKKFILNFRNHPLKTENLS